MSLDRANRGPPESIFGREACGSRRALPGEAQDMSSHVRMSRQPSPPAVRTVAGQALEMVAAEMRAGFPVSGRHLMADRLAKIALGKRDGAHAPRLSTRRGA